MDFLWTRASEDITRSLQNWESCEERQNKVIGEMEGLFRKILL